MKKVISILLVMIIVTMSFASCGSKKGGEETTAAPAGATAQTPAKGLTIGDKDHVALGNPAKTLDPEAVYSKLKYTPEMFMGVYYLPGGEEGKNNLAVTSEYSNFNYNGEDKNIADFPFKIEAGKNTTNHVISTIEGYNWARLTFSEMLSGDRPSTFSVFCAYTIEGNKIIYRPLSNYSFDSETEKATYAFSDVTFEYEFSFCGRDLTLSEGEKSITYTSGIYSNGNDEVRLLVNNYAFSEADSIDGIRFIRFTYGYSDPRLYFETAEEYIDNPVAFMEDNGRVTITVPFKAGTKTYQFVYFYCDFDGIILTDGDNTYHYTLSYREYNGYNAKKYLSEDQTGKLDSLTDEELEAIVEKKDNLLSELATAFANEGIKVTIDEEYGELIIDSSVIFGGDSAELTAEGKAFLNKFLKAYTSIVFSSKYENFILKTVVEGHTAPLQNSTYESGLPLSQQRADVVKNYCVSSETGVDTTKLAQALDAVGYSNSKPIHDANGKIDMNASRRVSFKFIINLDA